MEKVNKDGKEQELPGEHGLGLSKGPEEIPASDAREQTLAWAREKESLSQQMTPPLCQKVKRN